MHSDAEHHYVMKATGNYGFLLLYLLDRQGIATSIVNPKQIKYFSRVMMTVTKTTPKDACMITMYRVLLFTRCRLKPSCY